jgi:site-specific DNA-methyltransferase (adenine-specific)
MKQERDTFPISSENPNGLPIYSGFQSVAHFGRITLYHADCMDILRQTPDKFYDLCICDPPYGIGAASMQMGKGVGTDSRTWINKAWDNAAPSPEYFTELRRVSTDQIVWGANYMVEHLSSSPCWLIWDKMQEFSGAVFEMAWTSFDTPAKAFRMCRAEAYTNQVKIHPTQKPVALYRWLLKNYAKPGQRILDTHLGSGSIAIACDIEGYDMVGLEIDADYIAGARKRLADHQSQPRLFDAPKAEPPKQMTIE